MGELRSNVKTLIGITGRPRKKNQSDYSPENAHPGWGFSPGPFAKMGLGEFGACQCSPEKIHGNKNYKAYSSILANFVVMVFFSGLQWNAPNSPQPILAKGPGKNPNIWGGFVVGPWRQNSCFGFFSGPRCISVVTLVRTDTTLDHTQKK